MVTTKLIEFCEELKILQTPKIQEEFGKELKILYELGVECYEIEILIDLRIKEVGI